MTGGYAVLDLETTGLFPGGHDRVVEIAIVRLDERGLLDDSYATLVNPERDVGPTHLHGLTASDCVGAPLFRHVGGEILRRLRGRVVVGHNIAFDLRFLASEFDRMDCPIPPVPTICTLQLVRSLDAKLPNHRLLNCCVAFGIQRGEAHSALEDALATAALFREIQRREPSATDRGLPGRAAVDVETWPEVETLSGPLPRADARRKALLQESLIGGLVSRLPLVGESAESSSYQALLEQVLEDRRVTRDEAAALRDLAQTCGLGQETVTRIHAAYLEGAVKVALADGVVTERERRELEEFAVLLGQEPALVEQLIRAGAEPGSVVVAAAADRPDSCAERGSLRGRTVCFTGELHGTLGGSPISRETAQCLATNAGLIVAKSVTKRLDLLVVSDPNSQSAKARKAREYGTRVIVESVFWRSIGAPVD